MYDNKVYKITEHLFLHGKTTNVLQTEDTGRRQETITGITDR